MAKVKGICKNIDEECPYCMDKTPQEKEKSDFFCEGCKKPLFPIPTRGGSGKGGTDGGPNKLLIGIIAAVVVIGGGIGGYFAIQGGGEGEKVVLSLDKTNLELNVNESATLALSIQPDNATNKSVEWASSNASIATVNSNGLVTAVAEGTANITVTVVDGGKKATCIVTVEKNEMPPEPAVRISSLSLDKTNLLLKENDSATLTLTILPGDAANKDVTWSSSNESVATVDNGVVTAVKTGTTVIKVKSVDGSDKTVECEVTVILKNTGPHIGVLTFDYGVYTGDIKNGKANGTGELKYTKEHRISRHDEKERIAQPGDRISGIFVDNEPSTVKWFGRDGNLKESIIIGSTGL